MLDYRRPLAYLAPALIIVSLLVAACGGDNGAPTATTQPTATPTVTANGTPQPTPTAAATAVETPQPTPTRPDIVGAIRPTPTAMPTGETVTVDIQNITHQDVTIKTGTTIVWKNLDGVTHTATSPGNWDTGLIPAGQSSDQRIFNFPGTFAYFCRIHPEQMRATVTVTT